MADPRTYRPADRFFYGGLLVFLLFHALTAEANLLNSAFRNPGMALVLLILIQVLFPKLRASALANVLLVAIIVATVFHTLFFLFPTQP